MDALFELKEPKMPMATLVEYDPLLDSSDMGAENSTQPPILRYISPDSELQGP